MALEQLEGTRFSLTQNSRLIQIATDEILTVFPGIAIKAPDIAANEMGVWSLASVGNKGEIQYSSFTQPQYILQARNGCVWNPKLKITQVGGKLLLSDYTVNGEICPDAFWNNTFEKIFGTGLDIRDFYATPEGRAILDMILAKVFLAMHNDVYDVMYYGSHPLVTTSYENQYYTIEAGKFADFKDMMEVSDGGGVLTILDALADAGNDSHLDTAFAGGDITDDAFTGGSNNIAYYLDLLQSQAHHELKTVRNNNAADVVVLAHPAEFEALEDYYITTYGAIPEMAKYFTTGASGELKLAQNVLHYKGSPVVRMQGWKRFDDATGLNVHRLVAVARGVFGGAYDVLDLPGQRNVGMRIDQRLGGGTGFMGKIYMLSDFKLGTEVLESNLVSMISLVDTP